MSSEEQLTHFQRHDGGRFNVVQRFLAGLTKLGCLLINENVKNEFAKSAVVFNSWDSLKPNAKTFTNWMFEAQSDDVNEKLIGTGLIKFNIFSHYRSWQAMDYYSLGYCIVHSQCQWMLDLTFITKEKAEMLVAGTSDGPIGRSRVIGLKLDRHIGVM